MHHIYEENSCAEHKFLSFSKRKPHIELGFAQKRKMKTYSRRGRSLVLCEVNGRLKDSWDILFKFQGRDL
jgi:hypothetical protein